MWWVGPSGTDGVLPMTSTVEVSGLVKVYGRLRAVDGIDVTVQKGEVFSFLGPNGAGKTTTVEILEGLRRASEGTVRVLGLDPWTEMDRLRWKIGVIPQDFHFFPKLTPREALRLYARLFGRPGDIEGLLARVELSDKADAYYDTLSGGQRQKLGVALALVNDPEVCFLDEPTTGLDPRARRSIWDVIDRLRADGRTVFLTTHYLDEAQRLSDRIAIIHHGQILTSGAPDQIIAQFGQPERLRIVGEPAIAQRLAADGVSAVAANGTVEVELRSKEEALRILQLLVSSGIRWESFSTRTDTLEDVFLRLVGRFDESSSPTPTEVSGGSP